MDGNESAEGNFSGKPALPSSESYYPEQPKAIPEDKRNTKDNFREWKKKNNETLSPYNHKIVNSKYYDLMKYAVIIFAALVIVFAYMAFNDKFKTDVVCEAPNISIPECPTCPACPALKCPDNNISLTCGDVKFPDSLEVEVVNGSNG